MCAETVTSRGQLPNSQVWQPALKTSFQLQVSKGSGTAGFAASARAVKPHEERVLHINENFSWVPQSNLLQFSWVICGADRAFGIPSGALVCIVWTWNRYIRYANSKQLGSYSRYEAHGAPLLASYKCSFLPPSEMLAASNPQLCLMPGPFLAWPLYSLVLTLLKAARFG